MKQGYAFAGPPIESEADHIIQCLACGTRFDPRQLGELLRHEDWCTRDGNETPMPGHGRN